MGACARLVRCSESPSPLPSPPGRSLGGYLPGVPPEPLSVRARSRPRLSRALTSPQCHCEPCDASSVAGRDNLALCGCMAAEPHCATGATDDMVRWNRTLRGLRDPVPSGQRQQTRHDRTAVAKGTARRAPARVACNRRRNRNRCLYRNAQPPTRDHLHQGAIPGRRPSCHRAMMPRVPALPHGM